MGFYLLIKILCLFLNKILIQILMIVVVEEIKHGESLLIILSYSLAVKKKLFKHPKSRVQIKVINQ